MSRDWAPDRNPVHLAEVHSRSCLERKRALAAREEEPDHDLIGALDRALAIKDASA